jgi:cell division protein FtsN
MFLMRLSDIQDESAQSPSRKKPEAKTVEAPVKQKPRFDFYDLLKDSNVPVPPVDRQNKLQHKADGPPQEFLLQVASFRSVTDADQLRARLILLNLEAYTEKVVVRNGETWHRVMVGPFDSASKLSKARNTLLSNRFEALVLKRETRS